MITIVNQKYFSLVAKSASNNIIELPYRTKWGIKYNISKMSEIGNVSRFNIKCIFDICNIVDKISDYDVYTTIYDAYVISTFCGDRNGKYKISDYKNCKFNYE